MKESSISKTLALAGIALAVTLSTYYLYGRFKWLVDAETYAVDFRYRAGRFTPQNTNLVYIGIEQTTYSGEFADKENLKEETRWDNDPVAVAVRGNFPWNRFVWASVVEKLMKAGAKGVLIDIVYASQGKTEEEDEAFKKVLEKYSPRVVVGWTIQDTGDKKMGERMTFLQPSPSIVEPDFTSSSAIALGTSLLRPMVASVAIYPEPDGKVVRGYYQVTEADLYAKLYGEKTDLGIETVYDTLSSKGLKILGLEANLPAVGSSAPRFRYTGPPDTFYQIPLWQIIHPRVWRANFANGAYFKDKLILIGPTAAIFQDKHLSPFVDPSRDMKGPEIHMNILNAGIHNDFLTETSNAADKLTIAVAGIVALLLSLFISKPTLRVFVGLGLSYAYYKVIMWLYNEHALITVAASPILLLNINNVFALGYEFVLERIGRIKLKMTMGYYFSPKVLEEVLENPGSTDAKSADVTLLLTDLRNSTPLAETLGPQGMFTLLNQIFEAQTEAIMEHHGSLEHFLGDQFLSYWGAPQPQPDGTNQALLAARKLIIAMEEVKKKQTPEVRKIFGYGVAIHCGSVLFGNKGSAKRMDFGLVGDSVNEAARIEALTKYYGVQLLVSQEALNNIADPGEYRLVDRTIVKGKSEPVVLYELECLKTPDDFDVLKRDFDAAFKLYAEGEFQMALPMFQKLVDDRNDGPSKQMVERCRHLIEEPRPDWEGVWKMESK